MDPYQWKHSECFIRRRGKACVWFLLSLAAGLFAQAPRASAWQLPSPFELPEVEVRASPRETRKLDLPQGERLFDYAVSPSGPEAAILTRSASGQSQILLWEIDSGETRAIWHAEAPFAPRAIAWHPAGSSLFLLGPSGEESIIVRLDSAPSGWKPAVIFHSKRPLRRLLVGPRPFSIESEGPSRFYRLFFGETRVDGTSLIASVTERGDRYYEVTQPSSAPPPSTVTVVANSPPPFVANSALPEAFHPAGHIMLWVDGTHCFQAAHYAQDSWGKSTPLLAGKLCGGSVEPTPNGIGLTHWRQGTPGVDLYVSGEGQPTRQAADYGFVSVPLPTPDGRGFIGATKTGDALTMVYVPIDVPLANVSNAWMFLESPQDLDLLSKQAGLFRPLDNNDQLFQIYESEAYLCGGYFASVPTRPYLVTADIFWESFAAAYEGLFVLLERRQAIPAFWSFVHAADAALAKTDSRWAMAFHALAQLERPRPADPEAQQILEARGVGHSQVTGLDFNYGELQPRGHYTASLEEQRYFKAFRYLTSISAPEQGLSPTELQSLPPAVQEHARAWIGAYLAFIAPTRAPSVWAGLPSSIPSYARHPGTTPALFPLSWGFDNEVMLSTVFHSDWPAREQIAGAGGLRLLPSGLDVAAALGSPLARTLLAPDIEKYPPLAKALDDLRARAPLAATHPPENLYDRWMEALGASWADDSAIPGETAKELWASKRLQTGLASWATLRHATVLVNERTEAECGEGGFEWIQLTPPRGYVEPAPDTLEAIARLFDATAEAVRNSPALVGGVAPSFPDAAQDLEEAQKQKPALREGVLRRLSEAAAKTRYFAGIARKELKGEPLSAGEYEEILHVARTAEYYFLIFKSLASPDFALSNPDPMAKIADVAGGGGGIPYLEAAVGAPLEWDQVVPYFGRREIVKGSVYSYYEFSSPKPLTDTEWRARLADAARPAWVARFLSKAILSCPAKDPF